MNNLQSNVLEKQLEVLQKKEKEELKKISEKGFLDKINSIIAIKMKYYKLKQDLWKNNYSCVKSIA